MKLILRNIILVLSSILITSCGILFNRNPHKVEIRTSPDSCLVYSGDSLIGVTPLEFQRDSTIDTVVVKKANYKDHTIIYDTGIRAGLLFWDILPFGIPFVLTLSSRHTYKQSEPKYSFVLMERTDSTFAEQMLAAGYSSKNNHITLEGMALVGLSGGYLSGAMHYQRELFVISEDKEGTSKLGLFFSAGTSVLGAVGNTTEGKGLSAMSTYSIELYPKRNFFITKFIFGAGYSYYSYINKTGDDYQISGEGTAYKPAFMIQIIFQPYKTNFTFNMSIGYFNHGNVAQAGFGYRF